ncbi:MAG: glycosyltransferase family 2 protein [Chlamydiota bacterium]
MISVVILTHNRLSFLRECVASIRANPFSEYEIIIVDNASTDGTRDEFGDSPGVRVLRFENDAELSTCRNAGIDAARGDIIAFTDDDCVVEKDWLARIAIDLEDRDAVGGIARPLGEFSPPRWWDDEINWLVGLSVPGHYGPLAGEIYLPASLNLAYRAEVLKGLRFREGVSGLAGRNMTREDSDLWLRTRGGGYRTLFDPALVVYHRVPPGRLTLAFCMKRAFSDGFAAYHRGEGGAGLRSVSRFVLMQPFRFARRALTGGGRPRAIEVVWVIRQAGFLWAGATRRCARPFRRARRAARTAASAARTLWTVLYEGGILLLAEGLMRLGLLRRPLENIGPAPGNGRDPEGPGG